MVEGDPEDEVGQQAEERGKEASPRPDQDGRADHHRHQERAPATGQPAQIEIEARKAIQPGQEAQRPPPVGNPACEEKEEG